MTGQELREKFEREGMTFADWGRTNGFRPVVVSSVVGGFCRGVRGKAYACAKALNEQFGFVAYRPGSD